MAPQVRLQRGARTRFRRTWQAPGKSGGWVLAALLALAAGCSAPQAEQSPNPAGVDVDAASLAALRERRPDAVRLAQQGARALEQGAFEQAERFYAQAADAAPEAGWLKRQRCRALAGLGRRSEAISSCRSAFEEGARSAFDLRFLVGAYVAQQQEPTPLEVAQAYEFASLAVRQASEQPWGYAAMCEVAQRVGDDKLLATSLWQLQSVAPDHPETRALERSLAARRSLAGLISGWLALAACAGVTLYRRRLRAPG